MTWLFTVVIVGVLGVAAVLATGRGGAMAQVVDDRPDAIVPEGRLLDAADVRRVQFTTAVRGYRMAEVDALLDRLARELEQRATPDPPAVDPEEPGPP